MEISQSDFEELMKNWSMGSPSPFYKRERRLRDAEPVSVATFAGEKVSLIGTVDTDMFSTRGNTDFGVLVGVSPYRVVFYRAASVFSDLCRSYWLEVDVEGRTWQEGKVRKKEYRAARVARPTFKKGVMSQKIVFAGRKMRSNGKEDKVFEHELSDLKWLDPQTRELEGRKGQSFYDQLIEAYENRIPISISDLWLMENDSRRAIVTTPGGVAEGRAVRADTPVTSVPAAPAAAKAPPVAVEPEADAIVEPEPDVVGQTCPECGNRLKPGIEFCGKCGHRLGAEPTEGEPAVAAAVSLDTCPNCGKPVKPGIEFCGKCGHRLEEETVDDEPVQAEAVGEEVVEEEPSPPEVVAEEPVRHKCPDCGKQMEEDWQACPHCGTRPPSQCPECGKAMEADWKVCPYCGASVEA
jgi:RNA polymerase subunit RPABC4/transcription elongation factor Spt4